VPASGKVKVLVIIILLKTLEAAISGMAKLTGERS